MLRFVIRVGLAGLALGLARAGHGQEWWVDMLCIVAAIILFDLREGVQE